MPNQFLARPLRSCVLLSYCLVLAACQAPPEDPVSDEIDLRLENSRSVATRGPSTEFPLVWMEPVAIDGNLNVDTEPAMEAFSARNADIRDVLVSLFEESGLNLVISPDVSGEVTFDFKATSQEEALISLIDLLGLSFHREGDFVVVSGRQTRILSLDYVSGRGDFSNSSGSSSSVSSAEGNSAQSIDPWESLEVELRSLLGPGANVVIKPEACSVVVSGSVETVRLAERYLRNLEESLHRQVLIEVEVLEVTIDDEHRLGVGYSVFPEALPSDEGGLLDGGAAFITNLLTGGGVFQFGLIKSDRYSFLVDALKRAGQVRVLSRPRIVTLNNQPAKITVADQVPVIERQVIDGESTRTEFDIRFEDAGVVLNLLPQISANGDIVARIAPTITEIVGQVTTPDGLQVEPILSVRETSSTIRIKDGQSVVIGGLRFSRQTETVDKVPLLGDIPLLGLAFRRTIQTQRQIELVIILTPRYLNDERQAMGLTEAKAYYEEIKRPFHLGLFFDSPPDGRFLDSFSDGSLGTKLNEVVAGPDRTRLDSDAEARAPHLSNEGLGFALMRRAIEDYQAGRLHNARMRIEQAQEYSSLGGWPKLYLASIARREGDFTLATKYLEELHLMNRHHVLVINNLAALRLSAGRWLSARRLLEEAVMEMPDDHVLRCNLAAVLHGSGRPAEAISQLQTVLRKNPHNSVARTFLDTMLKIGTMVPVEPSR